MTDSSGTVEPNLFEEPGIARALRLTLIAIVVSALAVSVFTSLLLKWPLVPRLALVVAASSLIALEMGRSRWQRLGFLLALATIAYCALHAAALNDGMQSVGLATIPVLIVIASLLLSRRTFLFFSAAALLAPIGMLAMRYYVFRLEQLNDGDVGDYFIFAVICGTAALVGRLLSARIQEGFQLVRASERRYRRIFENIQDVYYEIRIDGTLLELSPAGDALFGIGCEQMIGRSLAEVCATPSEFDALVKDVLRQGRVSNRELVIDRPGGGAVYVLATASLQAGADGEERIIGSIRDVTDRRRAEEALRDSEARLRIALDAAGAGTFDFYPQSGNLIWSDITKKHFGMAPETEINHDLFLGAVHPDDRERVRQAGDSVAIPGGQLAIEYRVMGAADAKERWIAVRGRMLFDSDHRAVRLIGITQDISDRKHLEEELRRRVEELQTIMEVAPVALITAHDPECRAVTFNSMGASIFELDAAANSSSIPRGAPLCRFYRDDVEVPVRELPLQTAATGAEVRNSELEARLPSGRKKILWGNASPLHDSAGRVRGAIAAVQDVTEARERARALLRESEERFRNTADSAPVMMSFGNAERRLTFVNEQFVRFTGLPAELLLGDGWAQVIHPDDLEYARDVYYSGVENRASYQLEYRARRADGEYRHLLGSTSPRYIGGEYGGQVGSVVDITDLKRRQEEDVARQKWESVGMLASGIAHDFNNLLGSVLAQSELALAELAGGAVPDAELKRIGDIARRGSEIVRQLMIYAGKESAPSAFVDVSSLVSDMLPLLNVSTSKRASLKTDLPANLPAVRADAAQIRQIVMNLVTNASEAISDEGGMIRVSTRAVKLGPETMGAHGERLKEGDYLELEVSDSGPGITPQTQGSLFDPFFTTKSAGRGLGLAVVQGIVRTLQGAITVVSQPGIGATFRVLLPCSAKRLPEARETTCRSEMPAVREAAILIVEDEDQLREPVAKMLRSRRLSVTEAADGTAALEMIRAPESLMDVILLDITLPGASSRTVLEEARRRRPGALVIATSAYDEKAAVASLHGKPDCFLRKPYRVAELLDLIRERLSGATLC